MTLQLRVVVKGGASPFGALTPARSTLLSLPLLPTLDGFWARAAALRARLLRASRKARLADTLIAQSCIDHDIVLITRDADFRHFSRHGLTILSLVATVWRTRRLW